MFNKVFKIKEKNTNIILRRVRLNDVNKNYLHWFNDKIIKKFISYKPKNLEDLKKNVLKIISKKKFYFLP